MGKGNGNGKNRGRPTKFNPATCEIICEQLSKGRSLIEICKSDEMPDDSTVFRWLDGKGEEHAIFREQYARARELQADHFGDEIIEISDNAVNDWMLRNHGDGDDELVPNHDHINRARLRVDSRKWLMTKIAPKKYGDKQQLEHSGPDGGPAILQIVSKTPLK